MTFQTFFLSFRLEDKIKNICLIIFLSLILFSCGEKEEAEEESNITELEGTWKTECYYKEGYVHRLSGIRYNTDNYSYIDTLTFAGNVLTIKEEKHSDSSCATDYSIEEATHTFKKYGAAYFLAYSKNGYYFHVTVGSTSKITLQSSSAVSAFNSSSECSANDWELNTEKDCSNDDAGDTDYGLYLLTTNLWLNIDDNKPYPESIPSNTRFKYVKQ